MARSALSAGDAADAPRQVSVAQPLGVQAHAPTGEAATGAEAVAHYPATEGLSSTQILALVRGRRHGSTDSSSRCRRLRRRERLADRGSALRAAHFPAREDDREPARRRLAFDELLLVQLALLRRRRRRRAGAVAPALDESRALTERWLGSMLPFPLTRDQELAVEAVDADIACGGPDAALADGRGRVGQDRRRAVRDAPRRRARHAGRDDGPDRDARRAALRDDPVADAGRARPRGSC